jgi:transposase
MLKDIELENTTVILSVASTNGAVACPTCALVSSKVHSRYMRQPADLPWMHYTVRLHLEVRRFFCLNERCPRKTFAEPFPHLIQAYARRTLRQTHVLEELAFALGGKPGARLTEVLGCAVSRETLLRLVRGRQLPASPTPRVLGIDEWAYRRGRTYGTTLVDLERHCPVDLLADRSVASVEAWLKAHLGVQVVSRDRSPLFAEAISRGAPHAVQVADRWHVLKNLTEAVEEVLKQHRTVLQHLDTEEQHVSATEEQASSGSPEAIRPLPPRPVGRAQEEKRKARVERYEQVLALRKQGLPLEAIASRVGVSRRTVLRLLQAPGFPERKRRRPAKTVLDSYRESLYQRWQEGCHNSLQLYREIKEQGYSGSPAAVSRYVTCLRTGTWLSPSPQQPPLRSYTPHRAVWLFVQAQKKLTRQEQADIEEFQRRSADLVGLRDLIQRFVTLMQQRSLEQLDIWIADATNASWSEVRRFAHGLHNDYASISAALTLPWSQGQVEGQVNRLKLLKRQMYGRATFEVLRQRVLARPSTSHGKCA